MAKINFEELPEPGDRFVLGECVGSGVYGKVFSAVDSQEDDKKVAIKTQRLIKENVHFIQEEFRVLRDLSGHQNLPDFYGIYRKAGDLDEIWFVMELCEGGPVIDLVNSQLSKNRRMAEEHISFILKEILKALVHLHENHVMHRDIRASNVLLTKEGEIKVVDFGLCRKLSSTFGKTDTIIGSPCWMAPEVVANTQDADDSGYDNRSDTWALGITAIELGDGKAPFQDMHPTRAMFQIVRNPPPTLYRPANWSEPYNDFINECLIKNPEHRPYIVELLEHPFMTEVPENNYHLTQELKSLIQNMDLNETNEYSKEGVVMTNYLKKDRDDAPEKMLVEDLAAIDRLSEDTILQELQDRMIRGDFHSFIGDILLILNPNVKKNIYGDEFHQKYLFKSRSDNAPHIYAVADSAYQNALHHMTVQQILLAGESGSGKTTNYLHLVDHLLYVGKSFNINNDRIRDGVKLLHAFTHASTPFNDYSTRCVFKTEIIYGRTGKVSGAIFDVHQLEKWRVSSVDMSQANYHIFYYIYDGLAASDSLDKYKLKSGRRYRYLRIPEEAKPNTPRNNIQQNVIKYEKIQEIFKEFEFAYEEINTIMSVLAAILILGDVRFKEIGRDLAEIENEDCALNVAQLLQVEEKKFVWSLTNYCLVNKGTATRRKHTCDEARDARDVLANTLYSRLVDYIVNLINHKLSYGRAIFGEKYSVKILDLFGFECFKRNHLPQLFINCLNEQLHYHYLQRVFAWESLELNEEDVPFTPFHYYDNKPTLDQILAKEEGVLTLVDEASKLGHGGQYIIDYLEAKKREHVNVSGGMEFSINHYTGKVVYDAKEMPDRNRDFLPPEVIETLRTSKNHFIKSLFANKLTKMGNLYVSFEEKTVSNKGKYKFASSSSDEDASKPCTEHRYSQIKKMRTSIATFRALSLELLKELSVGGSTGSSHFVRCVRTDLQCTPGSFHGEIVRQQLRALAVVETAKTRQRGFPHRIPFPEFLRRYKFLAFDFDENVDITKDNCRLLLVRLKMEGWMIGKSRVCLKYYNEEYLSRLYETQVKKIIKIQSMMRAFLVKRRMQKDKKIKLNRTGSVAKQDDADMTEEEAAVVLQKAYRGIVCRKAYGPLVKQPYAKLDEETCKFIKYYCKKWKAKSIFQVLLQYRAAKYQDLYSLCQQVHFFNQNVVHGLQQTNNNIGLNLIDPKAQVNTWLGKAKPSVLKMPFRLDDVPYFDTSYMCDPLTNPGTSTEKEESWDTPFKWRDSVSNQITSSIQIVRDEPKITPPFVAHSKSNQRQSSPQEGYVDKLIHLPYNRDPSEPVRRLSTVISEPEFRSTANHYNQNQQTDYGSYNQNQQIRCNQNQEHMYSGYNQNQHNTYGNYKQNQDNTYGNYTQNQQTFGNYNQNQQNTYSNYSQNQQQNRNHYIEHKTSNSYVPPINKSDNKHCTFNKPVNFSKPNCYEITPQSNNRFQENYGNHSGRDYEKNENYNNTKSANKDFEYYKSPPTSLNKPKSTAANPIAELQKMGRKNIADSEDEPPFNFQGMLRKTNYNRESLKRIDEGVSTFAGKNSLNRRFSIANDRDDSNVVFNSKTSFKRTMSIDSLDNKKISTELAPGIFMEGTVADL